MAPFLDESLIDDVDAIAERDSRQTLRALATAGAQVREQITLSREGGIERVGGGERPRSVLVASLGGSAVVADVLELLAEPGSPVPVTVRRNLPLPGWVGPMDLVVAVSLSGRARGPVAVAAEAARRGASLLTVGAPDSPLARICAAARGIHIDVPHGRTSSRTALWSLLTPVMLAADGLGLIDCTERALMETADRLDEQAEACRPTSESFVNPAKILAVQLAESIPVILGDGPLNGVAAARAASMLQRTARIPASYGELPDAASQIVASFDGPFTAGGGRGVGERESAPDIFADPFLDGPAQPRLGLLMLRDVVPEEVSPEAAEVQELTDAVLQTAHDAGVRVATAVAEPGHPLTRLAGQIALTDFAATYLAIGLGLDPSVSPHVADLRDRRDRAAG